MSGPEINNGAYLLSLLPPLSRSRAFAPSLPTTEQTELSSIHTKPDATLASCYVQGAWEVEFRISLSPREVDIRL